MNSKNTQESIINRYKNIFLRTKNLLITPQKEWVVIFSEKSDFNKILSEFALPYIAIITLIAFVNSFTAHQDPDFTFALKNAIAQFTSYFGALVAIYYILINSIPRFAQISKKADIKELSVKITAYSMVVVFLIEILVLLIPQFYLFQIGGLGLYTGYIVWVGLNYLGDFETKDLKIVLTIIITLLILLLPYMISKAFAQLSGF
ncbi:YIP1 family protein [Plebeiibacterium marinum]|uniref:YIP1 family protein n=1 Tax=Plebeiibacterium marinum TaxID=2992111 RepID=A0AAE3SJQ0_9BACT|nr:YIP1 family protein [Plebeiobacterium marinum]MCW3805970.1 YIP1 family protein [Plebeiobacterium marinum]